MQDIPSGLQEDSSWELRLKGPDHSGKKLASILVELTGQQEPPFQDVPVEASKCTK